MKQFFYTYYVPSNATLAVVGDIDPKATKQLIQTYFGWMAKSPVPKPAAWAGPPPRATVERRLTVTDHIALPRVYMSWLAPPVQSPDFAAVQLLGGALGEGKASRLYRALVVEQKLAGEVDLDVDPLTLGSLMSLAVTAQKGVSESTLRAAVERELGRLASNPISERELLRARSKRITDIARQIETPIGQAQWLQELNAWYGNPDALPQVIDRLQKVTPQALQAQVQALGIADPSRRLTMSVVPAAATAPPVIAAEVKAMVKPPGGAPPASDPVPPQPPLDLSKGPPLGTVRPLVAPKAARYKTGGVDVLLVQRPGAPLIESVVVIPAGEALSPAGQGGPGERRGGDAHRGGGRAQRDRVCRCAGRARGLAARGGDRGLDAGVAECAARPL